MSARRDALFREIHELSLKHGVALSQYRELIWDYEMPGFFLSAEERTVNAGKTMAAVFTYGHLRLAIRRLRKCNRVHEEQTRAVDCHLDRSTETVKVEALTRLVREGQESSPTFLAVAAAQSVEEVKAALAETQVLTAV